MNKAQLKRRLVGAVVLVSLAVIFIPMMLDNRGNEIAVGPVIPDRDAGPFDDQLAHARPEPIQRSPQVVEPAVVTPVTPMLDPNLQPPTAAGKPAAPTVAQASLQSWVVQVGSFGQPDNAEGVATKLRAAGFDTVIEKAQVGSDLVYRVQVGPASTEARADKLRQRISDKLKMDGTIRLHPAG